MSNSGPYVDPKFARDSYRPKSYLMSPGMMRAREQYRVRNAVTGVLLFAFGVGVWAYSIRAVKQDNFEDVDEEARELAAARRESLARQGAHET